jgi:hypothetical protein
MERLLGGASSSSTSALLRLTVWVRPLELAVLPTAGTSLPVAGSCSTSARPGPGRGSAIRHEPQPVERLAWKQRRRHPLGRFRRFIQRTVRNPTTVLAKLSNKWNLPESMRLTPPGQKDGWSAANFSSMVGGMVPMQERLSTAQNLPSSTDPTKFVLITFRKWNVALRSLLTYPSEPTLVIVTFFQAAAKEHIPW